MLTEQQLLELEEIQKTLSSKGWKLIEEDIAKKIEAIKEEFLNISVTDDLINLGRGRVHVYREFIGLSTVVDDMLEKFKEDLEDQKSPERDE